MFLINSQIPFLTISSSMLEPILLPKLHILLADFPYNLSQSYHLTTHLGYLMRFRYDYISSFSSAQTHPSSLLLLITIHRE